MKEQFLEAKNTLYAYIDHHLNQKPFADSLRNNGRATVRRWLGEQHASQDEITALAQSMSLNGDQQEEFTDLVLSQVNYLSAEADTSSAHPDEIYIFEAFTLSGCAKAYPKLSPDEETAAIETFQAGESAKAKLCAEAYSLSNTERHELETLVSLGADAQEQLLMGNLKLVIRYVKKLKNMGVSEDDLNQEGILGLIRAMQSYVPGKASFSTYAVFWIKKFLLTSIANQGRSIHLSPNTTYVLGKIKETAAIFETRTGQTPTVEDISQITGFSPRRINNTLRSEQQSRSFSLDALCCCEAGDRRLADTIPDPDAEKQFDDVLKQKFDIMEALHRVLTPREMKVILLKFGFYDDMVKSFSEIGVIMGRTKECVRLIEKAALAKLRAEDSLKQCFLDSLT